MNKLLQIRNFINSQSQVVKSAFLNNCAVCHGLSGAGNLGYPNLTAGAWMWGGKLEDIYQTLKFGIRSGHDETRDSQMAAFGKDKILKPEDVDMLTDFVIGLKMASITQTKQIICTSKIAHLAMGLKVKASMNLEHQH